MSFEPVDVFVKDQLELPVEGAMVKVYNELGDVIFTQGTTDVDGKASFLLETLKYSMRFYKFHTTFSMPQFFEVLAAPEDNTFDVTAETFQPPAAEDPRLCVCSGYFRDLDGSPKRHLDIHFIAQFEPVMLDDAAIFAGELHIRTDKDGYAQVCLIRGANYTARIQDQPGQDPRCIRVPDQASANLPDLLLPVVDRVVFDSVGPYTLAAGASLELGVTLYDSGDVPLEGTANQDVNWKSSDTSIFTVLVGAETVTLHGVAAGTAELLVERSDQSIIKIPVTPIEGQPAEVTVTP